MTFPEDFGRSLVRPHWSLTLCTADIFMALASNDSFCAIRGISRFAKDRSSRNSLRSINGAGRWRKVQEVVVFCSHQNFQRLTSFQLSHKLAIRLFDSLYFGFFRCWALLSSPNFLGASGSHSFWVLSPLRALAGRGTWVSFCGAPYPTICLGNSPPLFSFSFFSFISL